MSNREHLLNVIFVFIATAALGAVLGLSVLRTVDKRLGEVAINIPEIKIPKTEVRLNVPDYTSPYGISTNVQQLQQGGAIDGLPTTIQQEPEQQWQPPANDNYRQLNQNIRASNRRSRKSTRPVEPVDDSNTSYDTLPPPDRLLADQPAGPAESSDLRDVLDSPDFIRSKQRLNNQNYYLASQQMESHKVSNYMPIDPHQSHRDIDHYAANRNHLGRAKKRSPECTPHQFTPANEYYDQPCRKDREQYYKDLNEMTDRQIIKFKKYAKFDKMSVRDYVNWLSLFLNEPDILTPHNNKNLLKLRGGVQLTEEDIPRDEHSPKTAVEYYQDLYDPNY